MAYLQELVLIDLEPALGLILRAEFFEKPARDFEFASQANSDEDS